MKKIICITAILAMLCGAAGCSADEDVKSLNVPETTTSQTEEVSEEEKTEAEKTQKPTEAPAAVNIEGINPLTGEEGYSVEANGKRPAAVMVNNIKAALPQYGVAQADIIYEVPVEGGITRLMAVYSDINNVPDVCSVRSCRYYYPLLCLGMDAIYIHWGEDKTIALDTLNRTGIDHIDGEFDSGLFYRDTERAAYMATEHTGYIRGEELPEMIEKKGFRTDIDSRYSGTIFIFDDEYTPSELDGNNITVSFSSEYFSTFTFDSESGGYKKFHSGNPHMDGRAGTQLEFENVFVLQTDVHPREDGYLMDVILSGGSGYYFANGKGQEIKWTKKGENEPIRIFDKDGNELTASIGKSYIGIIGAEKNIDFN